MRVALLGLSCPEAAPVEEDPTWLLNRKVVEKTFGLAMLVHRGQVCV